MAISASQVGDGQEACVLQITDTHLFSSNEGRLANVDTQASLGAVLDMALASKVPELLLVTGDIAQDPHQDAYKALVEQIRSRYSGALLCLPGNHDDPQVAGDLFAKRLVRFNNWQLLALDSHVQGEERGEIAEEEFERLDAELAASEAQHIMVALHHPPLELASPLDHGRVGNGHQLLARLAADGRVRGILFGHVHQAVQLEIGELKLFGTPSTCVQFMPLVQKFALDKKAPGCRFITLLRDGEIATQVMRLKDGMFPASLD